MPEETETEVSREERKAQHARERNAELQRASQEVNAVLAKYDATFEVSRISTIGPDGVERCKNMVQVVSL